MTTTTEGLLFSIANKDLDTDWRDFLQKEGLLEQIRTILNDIESDYMSPTKSTTSISSKPPITSVICPSAENILRWARFPFSSVQVIIMGQDPYPKRTNACGLAFSVPQGAPIPPSLQNIYKALVAQKIISKIPATGNLEAWSRQGVILLNTALTTIEGITGEHVGRWQSFTYKLAAAIGRAHPGTIYLLFGRPAQSLKPHIPKTCEILEWGHPSPMNKCNNEPANPKNFIKCPAFQLVNNMLCASGKEPINWDPCATLFANNVTKLRTNAEVTSTTADLELVEPLTMTTALTMTSSLTRNLLSQIEHTYLAVDDHLSAPDDDHIYAFVDGAARRNGRANATAGYACIIIRGIEMVQICGSVQPSAQGKPPTNNRAELMALHDLFIYAASEEFIQEYGNSPLVIGYDSEYAAGCLREWYDKWRSQPSPEPLKANLDIITVAHDFMVRVASARKIVWMKISSHEKEPKNYDSMEWYLWVGNKKVDELARSRA